MISCNVYQDLILLYLSGECGEDTKALVKTHMEQCADCCQYYEKLKNPLPELETPIYQDGDRKQENPETGGKNGTENNSSNNEELEVVQKVTCSLKRRWFVSLGAGIGALLTAAILIFLTINQVMGDGICFTSLDDRYYAKAYLHAVQIGNYEKAFSLIDVEGMYSEITYLDDTPEAIAETEAESLRIMQECVQYYEAMGFETYRELVHEQFLKQMQELETQGIEIKQIKVKESYQILNSDGTESWQVELEVRTSGQGGGQIMIMAKGSSLRSGGGVGISGEVEELAEYVRVGADVAGFYQKAYEMEE